MTGSVVFATVHTAEVDEKDTLEAVEGSPVEEIQAAITNAAQAC